MQKYSTGNLDLHIKEAKLVHDTQLIGSMDTFCRFYWQAEKC